MAWTPAVLSLLAALNLLTSVFGTPISLSKTESAAYSPIRMPITRKTRDVSRRDAIPADLSNGEFNYFVETQIGTPPQTVYLKIDTGSSDTWAYSPAACSAVNCQGGSFDPTQSSTFSEITPGGFNITYGDQSNKYGDYISDNLAISGVTIQGLQMGLALGGSDSDTFGIMGLGYDTLEATSSQYPSIMDDMVSQGLISDAFYSLWLDDLEASTGTILFGGYDPTKYSGSLVTLPIVPNNGIYQILQVSWTSLSITDQSGTNTYTADGFSETVVLDSGTSLASVPSDVFTSISQYFNVTAGSANYYIDCNIGSLEGSLDFGFPGVTIQVPFSELALPISGSSDCMFGLTPGDGPLGDTFLRSAYVVYDLGNNQISLAQTVF